MDLKNFYEENYLKLYNTGYIMQIMKEKKIITPNLTELYVKEYSKNKKYSTESTELSTLEQKIQKIENELVVRGIEKIFNENQTSTIKEMSNTLTEALIEMKNITGS